MCGEKRRLQYGWLQRQGSPPHVRGKGLVRAAMAVRQGITPACAGKSNSRIFKDWAAQDHPRVCGEKQGCNPCIDSPRGSPPRMRGKGDGTGYRLVQIGITPAYAGKSARRQKRWSSVQDHPRVCGEKACPAVLWCGLVGSPPRMRGKVSGILLCVATYRITPAYAGKSTLERAIAHNARDHPRVCGEKITSAMLFLSCLGSPPRMRGKDGCAVALAHGDRITPAYAGKRAKPSDYLRPDEDHPRVCGEKRIIA